VSVTIGVAPSGVGARLHLPALTGRPGVTVRPVSLPRIDSRRPELLPGANVELDGLDLFIVGTPPYCHLRHSELLLRAGIPLICEKPAGLNVAQALQIATLASRMNTECRVNFQLRFHPIVRQARQVACTRIPDEINITCTSSARRDKSGKPTWYWQQALGGGVWFSLLPHLIDLAYFLPRLVLTGASTPSQSAYAAGTSGTLP
jgi:predicted dehydrogenase